MDWAGRVVLAGSLRAEGLASEVLSFGSPTERPQSAASMPSRYAADNDTGGWARLWWHWAWPECCVSARPERSLDLSVCSLRTLPMSHFLLTSTPVYGHVAPMLTVGRGLVCRGHQVTMLTGRKYQGAVQSHAMTFQPLPDEVDYDDANLDAWLPGRKQFRGLAAGRYDIIGLFIRPLQSQYYAFMEALASESYDAVVSETAFLGVLPALLSVPAGHRIPIVGVSATPCR